MPSVSGGAKAVWGRTSVACTRLEAPIRAIAVVARNLACLYYRSIKSNTDSSMWAKALHTNSASGGFWGGPASEGTPDGSLPCLRGSIVPFVAGNADTWLVVVVTW